MSAQTKKQIVDRIKESFAQSAAVFLINVQGLSVTEMQKVRIALRENDIGTVQVAKARLMGHAFKDAGLMTVCRKNSNEINSASPVELGDIICGQIAAVFINKDAAAGAKKLAELKKEFEKDDFICGGVYSNKFIDLLKVKQLSDLPSYEVLVAQLASCLAAPTTKLARSLKEILAKVARVSKAVAEKPL